MDKFNLKEEIKHGSIYFPCAAYIVENEKDGLLAKYHWHCELEIIHFNKGKFILEVGMDKYIIENECFCFINSEELHLVRSEYPCSESAIVFNLKMLSFNIFDLTESELITPLLTKKLKIPRFIYKNDVVFSYIYKEYEKIISIYKENNIEKLYANCKDNVIPQIQVKISLLSILAILYKNDLLISESENITNDYKIEYIKKIILYVEDNYKQKIFIKDLAKEINMNEQYFCRFFKSIIGKSPLQYINEYRIKKSAELLRKTDMNIMDVCLESGFNNMGNFINTFKKHTGLTPMKYRKDNT